MKNARGFSLVELMVVLAIAGIVVMSGAPAFVNSMKKNRLSSQVNELMGAVALARSEAAKRSRMTISLCPSADAATCSVTDSWEIGWIMFVDADADLVVDAGDNDVLLKYFPELSGDNTLRTVGFDSSSSLQFTSDGFPSSGGTFVICDDRGDTFAKAVVISVVGQTRIAVDEDDDGIVNHPDGEAACPA